MAHLLQEVADGDGLRALFQPGRLSTLIAEHRSGARDHAELLWGIVNLGLWRREFAC